MIFLICIILFVLKMKKKKEKKRNSTPTSSNNNYINDCLKYFPQEINCKECLIFYKLY